MVLIFPVSLQLSFNTIQTHQLFGLNVLGLKNSDENTKEEFNNKINGIIEKSD